MSRRRFCTGTATVATLAGAGALSASRAAAQSTDGFDGWFDGVSNYDGVVDATGQSNVRVKVGVHTVAGPYGFGPAAVRVDPGTTVTWEWTGAGGTHNVTAADGSFESDLQSDAGATFEHTFASAGIFEYFCTPHKALGMKGAVVVGDVAVGSPQAAAASNEPDYGDWFADVPNYDGTVDATGQEAVTVKVGAVVNGNPYSFDPAAIHVDPGTTVTWEWTGEGGTHDVTAADGSFRSDLASEAGHTFEHTFASAGIYEYFCTPHRALGMKGAVVVGAGKSGAQGMTGGETLLVGGLGGAILAALFFMPLNELRRSERRHAN